jgi:hypothetical protein
VKKLELAGQRFGKLIAICDNGTSRFRKRQWMKLAQGYEEFLTHVARIMKHIGGA